MDATAFLPMIIGIAVEFSKTYPLPVDDFRQEVVAEFCTPAFQANLREVAEQDDDERATDRYVRAMARRVCWRVGLAEKAAVEGFEPEDVARYSPDVVVALLGSFFTWRLDGLLPSANDSHGMPTGRVPENERGVALAMMADLSRAYDTLSPSDASLLEETYVDPTSWVALGVELGVSSDAARMRHDRAVGRICRFLNNYRTIAEMEYEGVGKRRVMSNARAHAITSNQY